MQRDICGTMATWYWLNFGLITCHLFQTCWCPQPFSDYFLQPARLIEILLPWILLRLRLPWCAFRLLRTSWNKTCVATSMCCPSSPHPPARLPLLPSKTGGRQWGGISRHQAMSLQSSTLEMPHSAVLPTVGVGETMGNNMEQMTQADPSASPRPESRSRGMPREAVLHGLLRQLSPQKRRRMVQEHFSEDQRLALERYILGESDGCKDRKESVWS